MASSSRSRPRPRRAAFSSTAPDHAARAVQPRHRQLAERLDLNANGGNDQVGRGLGLAALIALDLDGGAGDDAIQARNGATDQLTCGTENDSVAAGSSRIPWAPTARSVDRGEPASPVATTWPPWPRSHAAPCESGTGRRAGIRVSGADDEDSLVTLALRRNGRLLGRASRDIPAGEARTIKVRLSRQAFALLKRRGTLRVRAIATAEDAAGNRAQERGVADPPLPGVAALTTRLSSDGRG